MAACAKFRVLVERFEEHLLMETRLRFDQLLIDPFECSILAIRERIMHRCFDRVVRIALVAVDVRDRMTDGAGDRGMGGRIGIHVVVWVVEFSAEERYWIVTARAPPRRFHVPVSFHQIISEFGDARQVSWVVKRAKSMSTVGPIFMNILMTFEAVLIIHEYVRVDKITVSRSRQ